MAKPTSPQEPKDQPQEPKRLGGFELLGRLGKGGMGTVLKARQVSMDRLVALKILPRKLAENEQFVQRFLREARSAAKLRHPNIVQAFDVGETEGYYFFAMEFVDGETLADIVRRDGPLEPNRALDIMKQTCSALAAAHEEGIVHRDIKPSNIMLDKKGEVRVTDFGLAKRTEGDVAVTADGAVVGTPAYVAPEMAKGGEADARSDLYSLGATIFCALAGRPPFEGKHFSEVIAKKVTEAAPPLATLAPRVDRRLCHIVDRLLRKNPEARYPSAKALLDDLDGLGKLQSVAAAARAEGHAMLAEAPTLEMTEGKRLERAARIEAQRPKSNRTTLIAVGAIVAILAIVGILLATRRPKDTATSGPDNRQPTTDNRKDLAAKTPEDAKKTTVLVVDEAEARRKATELAEKDRLAKARRQGEDLLKQADAAIAAKDYAKAHAAIKSLEALDLADFTDEATKKLAEIASREKSAAEWAKWDALKADAKKLIDAGKLDEAAKLLDGARALPLEGIAERVAEQMESIESARRKAAAAALAAYRDESDNVWALFKKRDYPAADKLLADLAADPRFGVRRSAAETKGVRPAGAEDIRIGDADSVAAHLKADQEAAKLLKEFWAAVERGVLARKGKFVSIAGKGGNVEKVEGGQVTLKVGAKEFTAPLLGMDAAQAAAIADLKEDAHGNLVKALFLLAEGEKLDDASDLLAASGNPPGKPFYQKRLNALKPPEKGPGPEPEKALDIERALSAAQKALLDRDYKLAKRALARAATLKPDDPRPHNMLETALAGLVQQALDAAKVSGLAEAEAAIEGANILKPEDTDVGALVAWLKVASKPAFADNFDRATLGPAWDISAGTWRLTRGELASEWGQDFSVYLKGARFQDFVLECDIRSVDKPGFLFGVLFRSTPKRWLYMFLNDGFNQVEGGGGLGPSWYHIGGPKAKDVTNKAARFNVETGQAYHFRLRCIQNDIECFMDGRPVIQLTDDKPATGELALFSAGTFAHFDNVRLYRPVPPPELKPRKPPGPAAEGDEPKPGCYALRFNGVDDDVGVPFADAHQLKGVFTVEARFYADADPPKAKVGSPIVVKRPPGSGPPGGTFVIRLHGRNLMFYVCSSEPLQWNSMQGPEIQLGRWYHVAFQYDEKRMAAYLDGERAGERLLKLPLRSDTGPIHIGRDVLDGDTFWGRIGEVRVWHCFRSEEQIRENMNSPLKGTEPNLVGYWDFSEGEGNVLHDRTRHKADGKIQGAEWVTRDGKPMTPGPRAKGPEATAPKAGEWQSLFDGKTLKGWKRLERVSGTLAAFGGGQGGAVRVKEGQIVFEGGHPVTGIVYTGKFPAARYEVSVDTMRVTGSLDCPAIVFPVGDQWCRLAVGGWDNTVVGLDSVDGQRANSNPTTRRMAVENARWYTVRLRVVSTAIETWIDDQKVVELPVAGRRLTVASGWPYDGFGIYAYGADTLARVRNVRLCRLTPVPEEAPHKEESDKGMATPTGRSLFDGKSLRGWKIMPLGGRPPEGLVKIADGQILCSSGSPASGIAYALYFPKDDYELFLQYSPRSSPEMTLFVDFPVGRWHAELLIGGAGRLATLTRVHTLAGAEPDQSLTSAKIEVQRDKWHGVRVRVSKTKLQVWFDDNRVIDFPLKGHRPEIITPGDTTSLKVYALTHAFAVRSIVVRHVEGEARDTPRKPDE